MIAQTNANPLTEPTRFDFDELRAFMAAVPEEPIAAWMKAQGHDPADGWVLVLPTTMMHMAGQLRPRYVWLSSLTLEPCFVMNPSIYTASTPSYKEWFQ